MLDDKANKIIQVWDLAMPLVIASVFLPPADEQKEVYEAVADLHILTEEDVNNMADEE